MDESKLKEMLYVEQQKAMIYGNMKRLNRINLILYAINQRQKKRKEIAKEEKRNKILDRLAEEYASRGE